MRKQLKATFLTTLWEYYDQHGRHNLPWRLPTIDGSFDPYAILVSEIMLQQTQVGRVIPKYLAFLQQFPTVESLAAAPLSQVLTLWSGFGYNRRAKFLWQAARLVREEYGGIFPRTVKGLVALAGVGPNTSGAIVAYAYNQPAIFIETNIRTVYIHHFFHDQQGIADAEIRQVVAETLDEHNPRLFYWAMMDYGAYLKSTVGNLNSASKTYARQSPFHGSKRQIRGQVIRLLTSKSRELAELEQTIADTRLDAVLQDLIQEEMIEVVADVYRLR